MVFSNGTILSLSDKSDSINERTQEINKLIKLHILWVWQKMSLSDKSDSINERTQEINELIQLHILGVWQYAHEFIRQLASCGCCC